MGWRLCWEYGYGPMTDFGVHLMDVARWFLDLDRPLSAYGVGQKAASPDVVPSIVEGLWKFDCALVTYSSRSEDITNRFWGDRGWLFVNRTFIRAALFSKRGQPPETKEIRVVDPGYESIKIANIANCAVHIKNFLDCVRSRQKPNCDPEIGAKSTIPCLLAAESVRTGKVYAWDGRNVKELFFIPIDGLPKPSSSYSRNFVSCGVCGRLSNGFVITRWSCLPTRSVGRGSSGRFRRRA
jgi:predicted dehydrogenase